MGKNIDYQELVEEILTENDWIFDIRREKEFTSFSFPMNAKNIPNLKVLFIVDSGGDCKIRNYIVRNITEEKRPRILAVINDLNKNFRYITLSLDEDGDISASYDFVIFSKNKNEIDKQVGTMVYITSEIMDKCFQKIMKVLWEDDEE